MTEDQIRKLRGHYHSLLSLQPLFESASAKGTYRENYAVDVLNDEIQLIRSAFPELLPDFNAHRLFSHEDSSGNK